jgi:FAD/FMN-containing dehydrogenase
MTATSPITTPKPLPWDHVTPWIPNTETFGDSRVSKKERKRGVVADASGVVRVVPAAIVRPNSVDEIRSALDGAKRNNLRVSIAGTRHSGGGQSLQQGTLLLDMRGMDGLRYDAATGALDVQPGATWEQVQRYLDARGRSVAVQQSSNVFSVGGSIATNIHGRDVRFGPLIDSIESVQVLLANGREVTASRSENSDLFAATVGGYGQTGVVTQARLRTVANEQYRREDVALPIDNLGERMRDLAARPDLRLLQVRLPVDWNNMFDKALAITFTTSSNAGGPRPMEPRKSSRIVNTVSRVIFRSSIHTNVGKRVLWEYQNRFDGRSQRGGVSRNQAMAPAVEFLRSNSHRHRQVLQEYFVPPEKLNPFLDALETIVKDHRANLLNVTLRWTPAQKSPTPLSYAPADRVAAVLYLDQPTGDDAQRRMDSFTHAATDAAVTVGGAPYLPYQLQGMSGAQIDQAYASRAAFFETVKRWDPNNLFAGSIEQLA